MEVENLDIRDADEFMLALGVARQDPEATAEADRRWPDGYSDYMRFLIDVFTRR